MPGLMRILLAEDSRNDAELAIAALAGWSPSQSPYLLAGALLYLAGTIFVTMAFNVPLNNRLAR